jgi:hypothetical protein
MNQGIQSTKRSQSFPFGRGFVAGNPGMAASVERTRASKRRRNFTRIGSPGLGKLVYSR